MALPGLSYCQSKSDKYPKQTVINEDTVVILSLQQALDMNKSFIELNNELDESKSEFDSIRRADSIKYEMLRVELDNQHSIYLNLDNKTKRHQSSVTTIILISFSAMFTTTIISALK